MKHILLKCAAVSAAVILGSIGAQAAWTYDADAKTLSNSENGYSFPAKVVTKTDPSNNQSVTGFEVTGTTVGSGDLDFTNVGTDMTGDYAGYNVISLKQDGTANRFVNNITSCTKLTAPHVLELCSYLFYGNHYLVEIVLSDGDEVKVKEIPERCFNTEYATLQKITPSKFPYVTEMIGGNQGLMFWKSTSLTSDFSFPNLKVIGNGAFMACWGVTNVSLPNVEKMVGGYGTFQGAGLVGNLEYEHLTFVSGSTFYGTKITSFKADGVTNVGASAFRNCSELTSIQLGADCATNYGDMAYAGCSKLVSLSPWPKLNNIKNTYDNKGNMNTLIDPLQGCEKLAGSIEMSSKEELMLTTGWMKNCKMITNVTIRAEVTNVAQNVFQNICPGAEIYWDAEKAPLVFGSNAFSPEGGTSKAFARIYVTQDIEGWTKLMSKVAADFTDSDKSKNGYPGKKTLGIINGNVYVVDGRAGLCIRIQ